MDQQNNPIDPNGYKKSDKPWLAIFIGIIILLLVLNGLKSCSSNIVESSKKKTAVEENSGKTTGNKNNSSDSKEDNNGNEEREEATEVDSIDSNMPPLTSLKIVESDKATIVEKAENSLGNMYENVLVLEGYDQPYVKYILDGQYERLILNISCLEHSWIEGEEFDFRILLDGDEDEPAYRTKISRTMAVTTVDVDVKGVRELNLIAGYGDNSSPYKGVIVSDGVLYKNYSDGDSFSSQANTQTDESAVSDVKITSEKIIEQDKASVEENVTDSLGNTYDRAVVLSGYDQPYVKYYLGGKYSRLSLDLSCLDHSWIEDKDTYDFRIILDGDEENPAYQTTISRAMEVDSISVDVSGAKFITILLGYGQYSSPYKGAILSNGMLYK